MDYPLGHGTGSTVRSEQQPAVWQTPKWVRTGCTTWERDGCASSAEDPISHELQITPGACNYVSPQAGCPSSVGVAYSRRSAPAEGRRPTTTAPRTAPPGFTIDPATGLSGPNGCRVVGFSVRVIDDAVARAKRPTSCWYGAPARSVLSASVAHRYFEYNQSCLISNHRRFRTSFRRRLRTSRRSGAATIRQSPRLPAHRRRGD